MNLPLRVGLLDNQGVGAEPRGQVLNLPLLDYEGVDGVAAGVFAGGDEGVDAGADRE